MNPSSYGVVKEPCDRSLIVLRNVLYLAVEPRKGKCVKEKGAYHLRGVLKSEGGGFCFFLFPL